MRPEGHDRLIENDDQHSYRIGQDGQSLNSRIHARHRNVKT